MFKSVIKSLALLCENHSGTNLLIKRSAGHSKWQNIRHIKGAKDAERAQLFTKIGRQIKVAVQEGGSIDPSKNLKLEQVVEQAKRANMPSATLQSMLKACQQEKTQGKGHIIEIKGPGNCFILCEVFTGQLAQLKMNMATILRKHKSKFGDGGGQYLFEEKGIILTHLPKDTSSEELLNTATDHAIESGAEEVEIIDEDTLQFVCGKTNLKQVVEGLERLKYDVTSASVEFIPLKTQNLDDEDLKMCKKLYDKLESLPEVVRLSNNIA